MKRRRVNTGSPAACACGKRASTRSKFSNKSGCKTGKSLGHRSKFGGGGKGGA